MNKFIKYISLIFLASFYINNANADGVLTHPSLSDGKNYFKIKAGAVQPNKIDGNTSFKAGNTNYVIGASVGRKILDFLFVDLEYMYFGKEKLNSSDSAATQTSWNIRSDALMANLKMNLLKNFEVMPYIKTGVGVSHNKSSKYNETDSSGVTVFNGKTINSLAWQIGIGMSFEYNEIIGTEFEYAYINLGKVKTQNSYVTTLNGITTRASGNEKNGTVTDNLITFGVKFRF